MTFKFFFWLLQFVDIFSKLNDNFLRNWKITVIILAFLTGCLSTIFEAIYSDNYSSFNLINKNFIILIVTIFFRFNGTIGIFQ